MFAARPDRSRRLSLVRVNGAATTIDAVEPAGLQLVELVEVPPYHYAAIFVRVPFQGAPIVARNIA